MIYKTEEGNTTVTVEIITNRPHRKLEKNKNTRTNGLQQIKEAKLIS